MFFNRIFYRYGIAALLLVCLTTGCYSSLGLEGGGGQLVTRFSGVDTVTVISPTSVTVNWTPLSAYSNYNVYMSTQDSPIESSRFNSLNISKLTPGTNYAFSVAGIKDDGTQDGIAKQITAQTWSIFSGPTSAQAIDSSNIRLDWSYTQGPTFQVFMNTGSAPSAAQLAGTPTLVSQSPTGTTIGGLKPNTTYYFAVIAKYADNTTSATNLNNEDTSLTGQYTYSRLVTLPTVTTAANVVSATYPRFTVAGAPATYRTYFYLGTTDPEDAGFVSSNLLALVTGNNTAASSTLLPEGSHTVYIKVKDLVSGAYAYATINNIVSAPNPLSSIATVSATTPTSLSPLPTVTANSPVHLGPFPSFTVSGAQPHYKTELFYGSQKIGSAYGNGTIQTLSSMPLPRGRITIQPKVTANSEYANLAPVIVTIKTIDTTPYTAPIGINGGKGGAAVGASATTGDFNCDGYPDLALGAPNAPFQQPYRYTGNSGNRHAGGVIVYSGSANGLVGLDPAITPSRQPSGLAPLLIPAPNTAYNNIYYGNFFGISLAAGNLNQASYNGKSCDSLVVGSNKDQSEGWSSVAGAIYVYYGSPTGLQVTDPYVFNGVTCIQPNQYTCSTGKYGVQGEPTDPGIGWQATGGFGTSVAVGDHNGDGYDDVAVGYPYRSPDAPALYYDGAVYLFYGTPNGLSPTYTKIFLPAGATTEEGARFGFSVAFGYLSDDPAASPRKKDLIAGIPYLSYTNGGSGVLWIKGTDNLSAAIEENGHLKVAAAGSAYKIIQPQQCKTGGWGFGCGTQITTADLNADGYDEMLFSSYFHNPSWTYNGSVFVYYGSAAGPYNDSIAPTVNQTTCTTPNSALGCNPQVFYRTDGYTYWHFGSALANLGDLDGDGYPEIGIGAQGATPSKSTNTYNGVAYLYRGSSLGLLSAPTTLINLSSSKYDNFGAAMVGANFRNKSFQAPASCAGQTCNDVVVTAPGEASSSQAFNHGSAHVFYNSGSGFGTSVTASNAKTPTVPAKLAALGFDAAIIVGDINGDGYDDVAAPLVTWSPVTGPSWGKAMQAANRYGFIIYYGSSQGLITSPEPSLTPLEPTAPLIVIDTLYPLNTLKNYGIGNYVFRAGDVNGDGFDDLATGSNFFVAVFMGSSSGLVVTPFPEVAPAAALDPRYVTYGTNVGLYNGHITGTSGDFNGDGYSDLAFTRAFYSAADRNAPAIIVYGSSNGPVTGGQILVPSDGAPYSAEPNPAKKASETPRCSGTWPNTICMPQMVCPYNANRCNGSTQHLNFSEPSGSPANIIDRQFMRLQAVGDIDKDGTDDLVATYGLDSSFYSNSGALYILYGSQEAGITPSRHVKLLITPQYVPMPLAHWARSLGQNNTFNHGLSNAQDVNGDGINDFVIGTGNESTGSNGNKSYRGGAAYLVYGINGGYRSLGPSVCADYPCTVTITEAADNIANFQPSEIVDNINGSCDPSTNQCNALRIHLTMTNYSNYGFGSGVLGIGDITGDGFGDVAVSSSFDFSYPGRIYVFSGSSSGLRVATQAAAQTTCTAGICNPYLLIPPTSITLPYVSESIMSYQVHGNAGAGDIDGDGKNDFLVTSPKFNDPNGNGYYVGGFFLFH